MAHTKLTDEQVAEMLAKADKQVLEQVGIERWPDKESQGIIKDAIEADQDYVILSTSVPGKLNQTRLTEFKIEYIVDKDDLVFIGPSEPGVYVPCGVFSVSRLVDSDS